MVPDDAIPALVWTLLSTSLAIYASSLAPNVLRAAVLAVVLALGSALVFWPVWSLLSGFDLAQSWQREDLNVAILFSRGAAVAALVGVGLVAIVFLITVLGFENYREPDYRKRRTWLQAASVPIGSALIVCVVYALILVVDHQPP